MISGQTIVAALACALVAGTAWARDSATARPNVVVIVVDDAGFMDFGPYGGEAATPALDALARRGAMLTRYHTSPLCSPSRAMLLTGLSNHRAGVATIPEVLPPEHKGKPGYSLHLEPGAVTVASRLKAAGYRTYMSGKWHLGDGAGQLPDSHGFDRSFALDASGADNWDHKSYMPYYATAPWYLDGKPARYPAGRYSSDVIVDRMAGWLEDGKASPEPFFAYVAFQAVHIPVQAPKAFSDRYKGRFDAGWEVLAAERFRRGQALGLIPASASPPPFHPSLRRWQSLSPEERAIEARAMEVYAGMIEAMDQAIGRLVDTVEALGQLESTVFIITSDNGPEPSDPSSQTGFDQWAALNGYHRDIARLGERGSTNWIGPEWASAVATPGHLFKFYAAGGGIRVPFIIAGPGVQPGLRSNASAFVSDVTPTLLEMAGVSGAPAGALPITGRSLAPLLSGTAAAVWGPSDGFGLEVSGNAAFFQGDYKLTKINPPYGDGQWRLYDIVADPGETRDLSAAQPERFAQLQAGYAAYAQANGVLELPEGYQIQRQVARNALKRQLELHGWKAALTLVVLCIAMVWWRRRARPKQMEQA